MNVNTVNRTTSRRRRQTAERKRVPVIEGDMLVKLYELLQGHRESVRVFSKALNSEICFVNTPLAADHSGVTDCPVYSARELSFILSLTAAEFQRYHYLKLKLT